MATGTWCSGVEGSRCRKKDGAASRENRLEALGTSTWANSFMGDRKGQPLAESSVRHSTQFSKTGMAPGDAVVRNVRA